MRLARRLPRALRRPRVAVPLGVVVLAVVAAAVAASSDGGGRRAPEPVAKRKPRPPVEPGHFDLRRRPQVVQLEGAGTQPKPNGSTKDDRPSPGAQSDAQVRAELRQARRELASFKHHLATAAFLQTGPRARVLPSGVAVAPDDAPDVVQRVILAGNEIARLPYKWGGGHGAWRDSGYDCSGSVSFALAGAGLLGRPMASGQFMRWGEPGPGRWLTIYANPGHIFMVVAGLRFDTGGQGRAGTRWQEAPRAVGGFAVRHPPGL